MTTEPIGQALQQGGTFPGARPFHGSLGCGADRKHVHAVHFFAGHAERRCFAPDLRITGGTVMGHADGPLVVFHHEQDRQLPQLRHVHALEELAVVAGAITEERCCDGVAGGVPQGITLVAAGEG